jgi:hypothetical protein
MAQQLLHRPPMIRQTGRHRRGATPPLPPPRRDLLAKALVFPTEIGRATHQEPPRPKRRFPVGEPTPPAHQRRHRAAERGVPALEGRRVDPRPGSRRQQHRHDRGGCPAHHPARQAHQAMAGPMLDHLADPQPGFLLQTGPARAACTHRVAEDARERRDRTGQAIDTDQDRQAPGTAADHPDQGRDQGQVAARADDPARARAATGRPSPSPSRRVGRPS